MKDEFEIILPFKGLGDITILLFYLPLFFSEQDDY